MCCTVTSINIITAIEYEAQRLSNQKSSYIVLSRENFFFFQAESIKVRNLNILTKTLSPSLSSRSPFLTDPVSERFEIESLVVRVRLLSWEGVASSLEDAALLRGVAAAAGTGDTFAEDTEVGEVALDVVCVPLVSSSSGFRDNFDGLVKIPLKASHWKYLTPATAPSFLPIASSNTIPAH